MHRRYTEKDNSKGAARTCLQDAGWSGRHPSWSIDQRFDVPNALSTLLLRVFTVALVVLPTSLVAQAHESTGHGDPVTPIVLALAVILAVAKVGGHLAVRMGQPAVLGELVAGVVLGAGMRAWSDRPATRSSVHRYRDDAPR